MTPLVKLLRDGWEKAFGRFYEGPAVPARLLQLVEYFAASKPKATRGDWIEFSTRAIAEAYRSGFVRGYERDARDGDSPRPTSEGVDRAAEYEGHAWSWMDAAPTTAELARDLPVRDGEVTEADVADEVRLANTLMDQHFRNHRAGRGPKRI